jgi:uncharacterized protein YybS (DUF2232 family)
VSHEMVKKIMVMEIKKLLRIHNVINIVVEIIWKIRKKLMFEYHINRVSIQILIGIILHGLKIIPLYGHSVKE